MLDRLSCHAADYSHGLGTSLAAQYSVVLVIMPEIDAFLNGDN